MKIEELKELTSNHVVSLYMHPIICMILLKRWLTIGGGITQSEIYVVT